MSHLTVDDCQRCGACCCNIDDNRAIDYVDYVEVERRDRLRKRPELLERLTVLNDDGIPHMRLDASQRCVALRGRVGRAVTCAIYLDRPSGCRRVQPNDEECLRARRERAVG